MYNVKSQIVTKQNPKQLKRKARDIYIASGTKAVSSDFRVVTIVWACAEGCLHPELFAFHKDTPSVGDVARQYHEIFDKDRTNNKEEYECQAYRLSNSFWILLDENDPIPQDGEILVINHILMNGVWSVNVYDDNHKLEKRCDWCFQPNACEKCGECRTTRYCNSKCQKLHWPFHKIKSNESEK